MKAFKQPYCEKGMTVLWYADNTATSEPSAAVVTEVHDQTIRCSVFQPDMANMDIKSGVRHKDDPQLHRVVHGNDSGCWDYIAKDKRMIEFAPDIFFPAEPKQVASAAQASNKAA